MNDEELHRLLMSDYDQSIERLNELADHKGIQLALAKVRADHAKGMSDDPGFGSVHTPRSLFKRLSFNLGVNDAERKVVFDPGKLSDPEMYRQGYESVANRPEKIDEEPDGILRTDEAREILDSAVKEVRTVSSTGGEKGTKPQRYDLIPVDPLDLLATLYGRGAQKYEAHNWRKGYSWSLSYAAAMRHMTLFWNGEDIDEEMGVPHVICAAFHMFTLAQFIQDQPDFDDRFVSRE